MPALKLTKNELKRQKDGLKRFERYLPTLEMKKRQLQRELGRVRRQRETVEKRWEERQAALEAWVELLGEDAGLEAWLEFQETEVRWENIAGVDVPVFVRARVKRQDYDLFLQPLWVDRALEALEELMSLAAEIVVWEEQERRLQRELRVTSQRVNLFEHVKIPEAKDNIRKISVYLADAQTAAFGWALTAKRKLQATI